MMFDILENVRQRAIIFYYQFVFSPQQQIHTHTHTHRGHLRTKLNLLQINANSIKDNSYLGSNLKRGMGVFSFLLIYVQMFFFKISFSCEF